MNLSRFAGRALALVAGLALAAAFAVVSPVTPDVGHLMGAGLSALQSPESVASGLVMAAAMPAVNMRAKFVVSSIAKHSETSETIAFNAVAKSSAYPEDGTDEDNTFAKWSPSASCSICITNPALVGKFEVGQKYYVDFSPAT